MLDLGIVPGFFKYPAAVFKVEAYIMLVRSAVSRSNQSLQRTLRDLASVDSRSSQWESVSISNAKFQRESIISRKTSLTFKSFCLGFSIAILSNNDTSVSWCPQKVGFSI